MKLRDAIQKRGARLHWRETGIARQFMGSMPRHSSVLDIGAGSGKLAQVLVDKKDVSVKLVDVVDHNESSLPLELYDGRRLPSDDDTFDTCLLVFVLHHAEDAGRLLTEAARVSKRQVIVVEDTPGNAFERLAWQRWDYFLNHAHHADIAVAHEAKSVAQWHEVFAAAGLNSLARHTFRTSFPVLGMYRHTAFILEK